MQFVKLLIDVTTTDRNTLLSILMRQKKFPCDFPSTCYLQILSPFPAGYETFSFFMEYY